MTLGQGDGAAAVVQVDANGDQGGDTGGRCPSQHLLTIGIELREVEMAVRVDQHEDFEVGATGRGDQ